MSDEEMVQVPKALIQVLFDLTTNTMDFGSGFYDDEEQEAMVFLANLLGIDPLLAIQKSHKCMWRAKFLGSDQPVHCLTDWYDQKWPEPHQRRYCVDCSGGQEERPIPIAKGVTPPNSETLFQSGRSPEEGSKP